MSVLRWPGAMPETNKGRLPEGEKAYNNGKMRVVDPLGDCEQTIHINLFFDGTNNNDDPNNKWRDSNHGTHTNVARLFRASKHRPENGVFSYYIVGVGTPFPEIGEETYSSAGKALAAGFSKRCVWGYTRVLNALHAAMAPESESRIIEDRDAAKICSTLDANLYSFKLAEREKHLGSFHEAMVRSCQRNRLIKKAYINVFGFSRGAAGARVFVSRLIKRWAKNGKLIDRIPYEVNFMGLFDTVASVGPPDSTRAAVDSDKFDGHFGWSGGGALNIPPQVRRCVHFFSIHEQRMSFPLDSIRQGKRYPADFVRLLEVAYPGVHSDVGGSYAPGDQGKSTKGEGHRLGKIPLHDMYIEALKAGVPLALDADGVEDRMREIVMQDFSIDPAVAKAFNDWRAKLPAMDSLEQALEFGLRQNLQWRALRARYHTGHYLTNQPFYRFCADKREDRKTPHALRTEADRRRKTDPEIERLKKENAGLDSKMKLLKARASSRRAIPQIMADMKELGDIKARIAANEAAILAREVAILAEVAGKKPEDCRPGEGADELVTNDRTDLLEAAEEFQLLLGFLHPDQQASLNVKTQSVERWFSFEDFRKGGIGPGGAIVGTWEKSGMHLCVPRADRPMTDSASVALVAPDAMVSTAALRKYYAVDDVLVEPAREMVAYLRATTAAKAVDEFALRERAAVEMFDNYIHDSRAWFRVPHFHEYAPGGYGWARTVFVGDDEKIRHLCMTGGAQRRAA